jgi:hypothetical protein
MTSICQTAGNCLSSALVAFQSLHTLFVSGGDPRKVANEIGVPPQDFVMFFHRFSQFLRRLRQALNVRCKQLQALRQSFMSFGKAIEAFVSRHFDILPLFRSGEADSDWCPKCIFPIVPFVIVCKSNSL